MESATKLARSEMQTGNYKDSIVIPKILIDNKLKAINSVYSSGYSCLDTLFSQDNPITVSNEFEYEIVFQINMLNTEQLEAVKSDLDGCNTYVGNLLCRFGFSLVSIDTLVEQNIINFNLATDSLINSKPLVKQLDSKSKYQVLLKTKVNSQSCFGNEDTDLIFTDIFKLHHSEATTLYFEKTVCSAKQINYYYEFSFDTTCNAKLLRTHYADYTSDDEPCPISPFIQNNYHKDAQQLAKLQIWDNPQPYNNQVAIPDTLLNKYHTALQAVYGSGYTCVDSIFQGSHPIHTSPFPYISILMEVPQTEGWVNALEVNKPLVGHNTLEPLLAQYNYYVKSYNNTANSTVEIVLKSDSILNDYAMIQKISEQTNYTLDTLYVSEIFSDGFTYPEDWSKMDTLAYTNIQANYTENSITFSRELFDNPSNYPFVNSSYTFSLDTTCNASLIKSFSYNSKLEYHIPEVDSLTLINLQPNNSTDLKLGVHFTNFGGFCTYSAQLDSTVENTLYINAAYNSNKTCLGYRVSDTIPVGNLSLGKYTIQFALTDSVGNLPNIQKSVSFEVKQPLSLDENKLVKFTLSPNPAKNTLQITGINHFGGFKILNLNGQSIKQGTLNNNQLDVSNLSSGIYILELNLGGMPYRQKFIKVQ